jgi:hypothetical protein
MYDVSEIKLKLKDILEPVVSHELEIMKQPNIKYAHIYCKINKLTGQQYGALIEKYVQVKYGMTKNKTSSCTGDLQCNQKNIELKVSLGGKYHNKFNYVQLRMNHSCEYILTAYYINIDNITCDGELFIFKLTKKDIKHIIYRYGGYAHGTKKRLGLITEADLENETNDKEYVIRPKYGDKCWLDLLNYRIDEISI